MRFCPRRASPISRYVALLIVFQSLPALISGFSTTKSSTGASSSIKEDVPYCWEAELLENAQPLSPAPPSLSASLEVLKRDGVVRLNSEAFRVDENLCATLRDRILAEIEKPNSFDSKPGDNYVDKYVPGTRLRPGERAMDLAFGGDARHDLLLPLNDENFSEVRPVLESAARQLEPLLLAAAEELLPRLHGSYKSSKENADENQIRVDSSSSELQRHDLSAEVVEVASLIVRQGSGHQNVHGDYRRFTGGNDCPKEEPLSHTEARDGKMPPRIVTFVALQDIPSDEHGATGFITGTHNSRSHGLIYGESATIDNENGLAQARQDVLQSSTRGVRTSRGFRRGEMLIYDASVLHWGGANLVPKNDRAILYFGVSRLNSAAQLGRSQPKLPGFEIVPPILLQDFVAPP